MRDTDLLAAAIEKAASGHMVVQAWLGYAEVLFLGFGDTVMLPSHGKHALPPYELQTFHARWSVCEGTRVVGTSDDDRQAAEAAIGRLVGRSIRDWSVEEQDMCLTVHLDGDMNLVVSPFSDPCEGNEDAWSLRCPDGTHVVVSCDLRVYQDSEST